MFGCVAFAETPFASIEAGVVYDVAVSESATGTVTFIARAVFATEFVGSASAIASVAANATFESDVAETGTVTDQVASGISVGSAIVESITGTDSTVATSSYNRVINESAAGSDLISGEQAFSGQFSGSASATDSQVGNLLVERDVAEGGLISDLPGTTPIIISAFVDAVTGTETVSAVPELNSDVSESADITGVVPTIATLNPVVLESAGITDEVLVSVVFVAAIQELIIGADAVTARRLWELINDFQAVTWNNVNTSETSDWTVIPTQP